MGAQVGSLCSREEWRPLAFAPGYFVSSRGRVKSPRKVLKPWDDGHGYLRVTIAGRQYKVHLLVADAFLPACLEPVAGIVDHKDGKKHRNHADNLERVTVAENLRRAWAHGLKKSVPPGKGKPGSRNNKKKPRRAKR